MIVRNSLRDKLITNSIGGKNVIDEENIVDEKDDDTYNRQLNYVIPNKDRQREGYINYMNNVLPSPYILSKKGLEETDLIYDDINIKLDANINTGVPELNNNVEYHICMYTINRGLEGISRSIPRPFLLYFAYKYPAENEDIVIFPFFNYNGNNVLDKTDVYLKNIFKNWDCQFVYKGYTQTNSEKVHLIYEYIGEYELITYKRNDKWWWITVDEIINHGTILNFKIHESVQSYLTLNKSLLFLYTNDNIKVETPLVAYYGGKKETTGFISAFGLRREPMSSSMGPFYYFGTYMRAGRYALWEADQKTIIPQGGIVRFVIFMGKIKGFLNRTSDKSIHIEEKDKNNSYIFQTRKLRDTNSDWAIDNESVYVTTINLNIDDKTRTIRSQYVVKDYDQQLPISSHDISGKQVSNTPFDTNETYYID